MVGVPGKYKGCETCRRRRVKCSNERPYCHKCINSGRQCEGYEREMVFITGTQEHRGRVALQPKKEIASASSSSKKQHPEASKSTTPEATPDFDFEGETNATSSPAGLSPATPLASAWEDYVRISNKESECYVFMTALRVPPQTITAVSSPSPGDQHSLNLTMSPYTPSELSAEESSTNTQARCLVHLAKADEATTSKQSFCLFLFETAHAPPPFGASDDATVSTIQAIGSQNFTAFPHHHFFSRVYRPMTAGAAVVNRKSNFLVEAEWATIPWERHPKSLMDQLLDLVLYLPSLLEQMDRLIPCQATLSRRNEIQRLLHSSLALEERLEGWFQMANQGTVEHPLSFWVEEVMASGTDLPFNHSYSFKNSETSIMFVYYWMTQISLQRCIDCLCNNLYQPVVDNYPDVWPEAPSMTLNSTERYYHTREMADNVCRGLDSALDGTLQPDLLIAPLMIAQEYYRDINATYQDALLEMMWLESFRGYVTEKGQYLSSVFQQNRWCEIARW